MIFSWKSLLKTMRSLRSQTARLDKLQFQLGRIELNQKLILKPKELVGQEFSVFSQWGEDGIIQYLVREVPIPHPTFVEFGVENYLEANTRFLLMNNNWSGLVLDGSEANVRFIQSDPIYWRHQLKAVSAFIDRDNINGLIQDNGIKGDIGLLSVDIDGNDYWVWESIECIQPRIVVCEYNSLFGPDAAVSIPYSKAFTRSSSHFSHLYYGASIAALNHLAKKKGYALVGGNSAGNNVFFVRKDCLGGIPELTPREAYRVSKFRESRGQEGGLTYLGHQEARRLLADLPLVNVESGETRRWGDHA